MGEWLDEHPATLVELQSRTELVLVIADPTKVFLSKRGPEWYRRQGILLKTLKRIELEAITVNPLAPQSHSFDSAQLRGLLEAAIPDVPVFDVLHADYSRREPRLEMTLGSARARRQAR